MIQEDKNGSQYPIIAIGLSAGGLKPLHQLLAHLTPPVNAAIIVVQHLYRDHRSFAVPLLQKHTSIPVVPVTDGIRLMTNHIYVLPENVMMTYDRGCLWLRKRKAEEIINRAIDILMDSMAAALKDRAISVVLSGLDGDGSLGSLHIGQQGGTTIAQLPSTAEQPSMPDGAITKGKAQHILTPLGIADFITMKSQVSN